MRIDFRQSSPFTSKRLKSRLSNWWQSRSLECDCHHLTIVYLLRHRKERTLQPSAEDAGASGDACHPSDEYKVLLHSYLSDTNARAPCIRHQSYRMSTIVLVEHEVRRVPIVPNHGCGWQRKTMSTAIRLTNPMVGRGGTQVLPAPIILVVRDGLSAVYLVHAADTTTYPSNLTSCCGCQVLGVLTDFCDEAKILLADTSGVSPRNAWIGRIFVWKIQL